MDQRPPLLPVCRIVGLHTHVQAQQEVIEVHAQGEAKREQIQEELVRIEADLKQAMLETAN